MKQSFQKLKTKSITWYWLYCRILMGRGGLMGYVSRGPQVSVWWSSLSQRKCICSYNDWPLTEAQSSVAAESTPGADILFNHRDHELKEEMTKIAKHCRHYYEPEGLDSDWPVKVEDASLCRLIRDSPSIPLNSQHYSKLVWSSVHFQLEEQDKSQW